MPADGRSAVVKVGGQEINVFSGPDVVAVAKENAVGVDHFCLTMEAASVDDLMADLWQAGIAIVRGPVAFRDGISVFVSDPDGVLVELRLEQKQTG
jgi:catechol 2,3-dioxygenase-like lactoylglutathione lyase family enzyme